MSALDAARKDAERTPLLADVRSREAAAADPSLIKPAKPGITPLPWRQVFLVGFARLVEPISYSVIFPFINQMIEDLHIADEPRQVGYYAGIVESLFALTQFFTVLWWGRLSDRIGRKPVLISGLLGAGLSTAAFGFSRSWIALIVTRSICGVLNGNAGVVKVVMAELTDETNKSQAFALLPLTWAIGTCFGSLIGGYLSRPAYQYPRLFGHFEPFIAYPYLLPCLVASLCPIVGAIILALFLKETLIVTKVSNGPGAIEEGVDGKKSAATASILSLLTRRVGLVLLNYGILALHTSSLAALVPLYSYTSIKHGGLSLTTNTIGLALAIQGMASCLLQLIAFPPLQRWLGSVLAFRSTVSGYMAVFALMPLLHVLVAASAIDDIQTIVAASLFVLLIVAAASNMAYSCMSILVADAAPLRQSLGTINGMAQSVASLMRALGPAAATSLFAFSVQHDILGGRIVWLVLFLLAGTNTITSYLLKEEGARWREQITEHSR